jgi:hypothetical protein
MAKKVQVSEAIQNKFNKPQFKIGDAVYFIWLGNKQYGYVRKTKQTSWGIQYTVESASGVKYPCGIQIQGQKTHYNTGYIFYDDTRSIGNDECIKRIVPTTYTRVYTQPARTETKSGDDDKSSRRDASENSGKTKPARKTRSSKPNDVAPSTAGNGASNTGKRKNTNTELDNAIEKQRNFLSGFVKKD